MKHRIPFIILLIVILTIFASCDGTVDEAIFNNRHIYEIKLDGSFVCTQAGCNYVLEKSQSPYIAVLKNGQPSEIVSLTPGLSTTIGFGTIEVNDEGNHFTYRNESSYAQQVVILTNNGTLTIEGKKGQNKETSDEIIHYGYALKTEADVAPYCYLIHAIVGELNLEAGKAIADEKGLVGLLKASENSEIEEINGGIFIIPENTSSEDIPKQMAESLGYKIESSLFVIDEDSEKGKERKEKIEAKENESYVISTKEELLFFRDNYNQGYHVDNRTIVLGADIDLTGEEWIPIGTWAYPFYGNFDGKGHKIIGMSSASHHQPEDIISIGRTTKEGEVFGFFGIVGDVNGHVDGDTDVSISNVEFVDVDIESSVIQNVGVVIGYAPTSDNFSDPDGKGGEFAPGKWSNVNDYIGKCDIVIKNVSVSGKMKVKAHAGGFIGKLYSEASAYFYECTNDMSITTYENGGLAGFVAYNNSEDLSLVNCKNTEKSCLTFTGNNVNVQIGDFYAGGTSVHKVTIINCSSDISVVFKGTPNAITTHFVEERVFKNLSATKISSYGKLILDECSVSSSINNGHYLTLKNCSCPEASVVNKAGAESLIIKSGSYLSVTNSAGEGKISINGGSFSKNIADLTSNPVVYVSEKFVVKSAEYVPTKDMNQFQVKAIFDNYEMYCDTFANAVALKEPLTLLKDVEIESVATVSSLTINLNGNDFTVNSITCKSTASDKLYDLTINGKGTLSVKDLKCGKLKITGATVSVDNLSSEKVYLYDSKSPDYGSVLKINVSNTETKALIYKNDNENSLLYLLYNKDGSSNHLKYSGKSTYKTYTLNEFQNK